MATASRDRLLHIFSVADPEGGSMGNSGRGSYQHIQTIDDHSASITALRFTGEGSHLTPQVPSVVCGVVGLNCVSHL